MRENKDIQRTEGLCAVTTSLHQAPAFLLVGIAGVYNYGCEAIVRGTASMLRERWPSCRITYASYRATYDRRVLSDVEGLEVVQASRRFGVQRLAHALIRRMRPGCPLPLAIDRELLVSTDAVLSIGGDMYTLTGSERGTSYYHPLAELGSKSLSHGTPYVLWGASVGPFDAFPPSAQYYLKHLNQLPLITAREPRTKDYLETLGCRTRIVSVADPAFIMEAQETPLPFAPSDEDTIVAVNFSPLSARQVFSEDNQDQAMDLVVDCLRHLLRLSHLKLILVPHTVCGDLQIDDDMQFLGEVYRRLGNTDGRAMLLSETLGARRTKYVLSACDVVIAARMHCAIASVSSGVPTIFVGYSDKARGMAQYVYGDEQWFVPLREITSGALVDRATALLKVRGEVAEHLLGSQGKWSYDARQGISALCDIMTAAES